MAYAGQVSGMMDQSGMGQGFGTVPHTQQLQQGQGLTAGAQNVAAQTQQEGSFGFPSGGPIYSRQMGSTAPFPLQANVVHSRGDHSVGDAANG